MLGGTKALTIKQFEDFAKSVHIPFDFLFLDSVPVERIPLPVFRGEARQSQISVFSAERILSGVDREGTKMKSTSIYTFFCMRD